MLVGNRIAGEDRLAADRHGEMRLADTRRAQQQAAVAIADPELRRPLIEYEQLVGGRW